MLFDKAHIANQNENLRLLQSQLTDQQNRFAAGTVPRFDVLQASVAVANQRPNVITAQNTYNLGFIGLARTLGIEYGPHAGTRCRRSNSSATSTTTRRISRADAGVAAGKANRALLKQQRLDHPRRDRGTSASPPPATSRPWSPRAAEVRNDALTDDLGHTLTVGSSAAQFNWNIFDGLATYGRVKQASATLREARITYEDDVNSVVQTSRTIT